ncbi:MAG TPA: lamin tail domain-containing protein, partial [Actinomycetota bacterium]
MVGRWRWLVAATAVLGLVAGPAAASGGPVEPFFSEYLEGAGASKALEVFNPSGEPLDLEGYDVQMFFNGSDQAGLTIPLAGEIGPRDVHVLVQSSSAPDVLAAADQTAGGFWFNGDDAVVLRHDGAVVDAIGQVGLDPGVEWGTGATSTADATLRRSVSASGGDPVATDPFDPSQG